VQPGSALISIWCSWRRRASDLNSPTAHLYRALLSVSSIYGGLLFAIILLISVLSFLGGVFVGIIVCLLQHGCEESRWALRQSGAAHVHQHGWSFVRTFALRYDDNSMYWVNEMKVMKAMKIECDCALLHTIENDERLSKRTNPVKPVQVAKQLNGQCYKQQNGP
jgi:hypothetical protein